MTGAEYKDQIWTVYICQLKILQYSRGAVFFSKCGW